MLSYALFIAATFTNTADAKSLARRRVEARELAQNIDRGAFVHTDKYGIERIATNVTETAIGCEPGDMRVAVEVGTDYALEITVVGRTNYGNTLMWKSNHSDVRDASGSVCISEDSLMTGNYFIHAAISADGKADAAWYTLLNTYDFEDDRFQLDYTETVQLGVDLWNEPESGYNENHEMLNPSVQIHITQTRLPDRDGYDHRRR